MPANLSASNRSQLAYKLEGVYPTNFGSLQAGNGKNLNMLSESLNFDVKYEQSKQLRGDGQIPAVVQVSASTMGGFQFEAQFKEYDPFIEGVMKSTFVHYGTNGVSTANALTLTATTTTLTASSATAGADIFTGLRKGQWFGIIPVAGATQAVKDYLKGRAFRVSPTVAPSSTVITLDAATPINTAIITAPLAAGWRISSSRLYNGTTAPVIKSYSVEVGHQDVSVFRQYLGMIPSKMDLKLSVGAIITGSFEFMGKAMTSPLPTVTGMGTADPSNNYVPANATRGVFDVFENGGALSATTYVKSGEFSIDAGLRAQDAVGVFGTAGVGVGTFKVSGKLQVYFADATIFNKILNGDTTSITLPILDVNGNGYIYHFPMVTYSALKVNVGGQDQDNMLDIDFMSTLDPSATSETFQQTVAIYRVGI